MKLNEYLKDQRIKANVTQSDIAKKLKISNAQYVSNFERGVCKPSFQMIRAYIKLCGVSSQDIRIKMIDDYYEMLKKEIK